MMDMTLLRKRETGLPVNIWVYEGESYNKKIINFQGNKLEDTDNNSMFPMSISENPENKPDSKINLSQQDIDLVKNFVKLNLGILLNLGESIGIIEFCKQMKRTNG